MAGAKRKSTSSGGGAPPTKRGKQAVNTKANAGGGTRGVSIATSTSTATAGTAAGDDDHVTPTAAATTTSNDTVVMMDPQEESLSTSTSLYEYLERLPLSTLRSLYALPAPRGPIVCASVLRSTCLTELARQFALRLVACGGSFAVSSILEGWVPRSARCQREALLALKRLEIMGMVEPQLGLAGRRRLVGNTADNDEEEDEDDDDGDGSRLTKLMGKDVQLTPEFLDSMKLYLSTSSSSPWPIITREQIIAAAAKKNEGGDTIGDQTTEIEHKPSRDPPIRQELEKYTQSSWDSVLHFLVGSDDTTTTDECGGGNDGGERPSIGEPSEAMVQFLTRIGLMQVDPDYTGRDKSRAPLVITSKGYEFMLRDTNAQVWQFVLQYLNSLAQHHHHHEKKDAIRIDALSYLICLGSTRVGDGYHISTVVKNNKAARQIMKDFGRFGLVFFCRVADKTAFYPTSLVVNLIASNEKASPTQEDVGGDATTSSPSVAATRSLEESLSATIPSRSHLAVIVQTNFQVVAYTRSKLHISTLGLFCDISSYRRLPNVIIFFITRDSIKSALRLGVTAGQILRFLHVHAHPMLRDGDGPLVPANVRDQILLWDRERRRVVMDEVHASRALNFCRVVVCINQMHFFVILLS